MSTGPGTSYPNTHNRIRARRGPASAYLCVDHFARGIGQAAHHWSYTGDDPLEVVGRSFGAGRWRRVVFSLNIDWCYVPRCRSCHRRHDLELAARKARS